MKYSGSIKIFLADKLREMCEINTKSEVKRMRPFFKNQSITFYDQAKTCFQEIIELRAFNSHHLKVHKNRDRLLLP